MSLRRLDGYAALGPRVSGFWGLMLVASFVVYASSSIWVMQNVKREYRLFALACPGLWLLRAEWFEEPPGPWRRVAALAVGCFAISGLALLAV